MEGWQFEENGREMLHYVTSYLDNIRSRRALPDVEPGFMRGLIPDSAPEEAETFDEVMKDVERVIMPGVTHWQSPNFFAYFPTASSYPSMLADILTNAIASLGFTWATCPSCTELEVLMMDWLGKMLQLPDSFLFSGPGKGGGVIQGTASEATLMCLLSARTLFFKNGKDKDPDLTMGQLVDRLVAYCSDQAHSSVERAGLIGAVHMRKLETDSKGSLRGATLRAAIEEDKAKGLIPFFVCATLGTTTSCAFDNLKEIGPVCQENGVWMHIDAAYAGSAFVCPEFRPLLDGVEYATSFNFNPHKWLKVMFDCSTLWVQNTEHLRYAFDVDPVYLKHKNQDVLPDFRHWQIPFGRKFRSLKIWFVLRLFGQKKLQEFIRKNEIDFILEEMAEPAQLTHPLKKDVKLAHEFEALVRSDDRFEITADVVLGLVCFRLKGPNDLSEKLVRDLNSEGKIHLVPSKMRDVFFLRLAICSPFCQSSDVTHAWDVIQNVADVVLNCHKAI